MAQRPYIVGNWKMHGTRAMLSEARAIDRAAERLIKAEVAIAPPFTLIHASRKEASASARPRRSATPGRPSRSSPASSTTRCRGATASPRK